MTSIATASSIQTGQSRRVVVGMSGGVDSSVAALLLQQRGYAVTGLFMKNWEEDDPEFPCSAKEDAKDALQVCDRLGMELDAVSFVVEYRERVFAHFLAEYEQGRTPNPDILCNTEIKFRAFLDHALAQGADHIATGHYARVACREDQYHLLKARDESKDQSYFLHGLTQAQLSRAIFPLGDIPKTEVRRIAEQAGFLNHAKKDSTGICFIGERNFRRFLTRYLGAQPGPMLTPEGDVVGEHLGLMHYTLGQRQGLGIGGRKGDNGDAWYVVAKDVAANKLIVAQGHDHPLLYSRALVSEPLHWINAQPAVFPLLCSAKTRYRQSDQACSVTRLDNGQFQIEFTVPQWAVTPGQYVVLYQGDECLGGGVIARALA